MNASVLIKISQLRAPYEKMEKEKSKPLCKM